MFGAFAVIEVGRAVWNAPPMPLLYGALAAFAIGFAFYRWQLYFPEIRKLRLAADGEKAVGQFLEQLRGSGYSVFHDIPADGFNIDHVLVGPSGVYTVETKTWSKPRRGRAEISFDGHRVLVNGRTPDRNPIVQARAQATWLSAEIEGWLGKRPLVKPIVLFPGWWIESTEGSFRDIWVLEPKALPKFLEKESSQLSEEQVRSMSYHLSRYVRTFSPTSG